MESKFVLTRVCKVLTIQLFITFFETYFSTILMLLAEIGAWWGTVNQRCTQLATVRCPRTQVNCSVTFSSCSLLSVYLSICLSVFVCQSKVPFKQKRKTFSKIAITITSKIQTTRARGNSMLVFCRGAHKLLTSPHLHIRTYHTHIYTHTGQQSSGVLQVCLHPCSVRCPPLHPLWLVPPAAAGRALPEHWGWAVKTQIIT